MKKLIPIFLIYIFFTSCGGGGGSSDVLPPPGNTGNTTTNDGFDRTTILTSTYDNIIIPAYNDFNNKLTYLKSSIELFSNNPDGINLNEVRTKWRSAYIAWQNIAMFDIREAESLFFSAIMNSYPANEDVINANINNAVTLLQGISSAELGSTGFPALGYLIYGLGNDSNDVISYYNSNNSTNRIGYLNAVINQMTTNTNLVIEDWNNSRSTFVNSSGNSATSSLNLIVNDFLYYLEKRVREAKTAIPSAVRTNFIPLPTHVESFYKPDLCKKLLIQAFESVDRFYYGKSFDGTELNSGLKSYLEYLGNNETLISEIDNKINMIYIEISQVDDNFITQLNTDPTGITDIFYKIQDLVPLMKTDMLSVFNISTDYLDNDGD
tara:strand:- start:7470 stop:8609 length:1140 start_codon:yes stop_codon:yes gene_type:complete